ncbi:MAG: serine/threonine protein kinase [Myxococcota bacterium]
MKPNQIFLAFVLAVLGAACGPSFVASTPPSFVELDTNDDAYDYRETTAEGVVIGIREFDNKPRGPLQFWVTTVENRIRERGGYALIKKVDVTSKDGIAGKQLQFGHDDASGRPHLYYLSIFVTDDLIQVLETGGSKELMAKRSSEVAAALAGFSTQ